MSFSILLAEPKSVHNLYPFSLLHCSWEVRCGALRLFEKYEKRFVNTPIYYYGRDAHLRSFISRFLSSAQEFPSGNILVVNGSLILTASVSQKFESMIQKNPDSCVVFTSNDIPFAYYIPMFGDANFQPYTSFFEAFSKHPLVENAKSYEIESHLVTYLWDALEYNSMALHDDAVLFTDYELLHSNPRSGVYVENPEAVLSAENSSISPGVVLDASDGPIILGKNVRIMAQATIIGPCYIGDNTVVKIGAKIYAHTSIGPWSKVGGEIENSIIHGYSNKQHDGFLGHSYIGEWVNLGADTNTSDLKNTYGKIKVVLHGETVDTGRMFLGLLCGDHTKCGINSMFSTGTVAGIFANIFGSGYPPTEIGSFTWGDNNTHYNLEKALTVAETVMKRRDCIPTQEEIELWRSVCRSI